MRGKTVIILRKIIEKWKSTKTMDTDKLLEEICAYLEAAEPKTFRDFEESP